MKSLPLFLSFLFEPDYEKFDGNRCIYLSGNTTTERVWIRTLALRWVIRIELQTKIYNLMKKIEDQCKHAYGYLPKYTDIVQPHPQGKVKLYASTE